MLSDSEDWWGWDCIRKSFRDQAWQRDHLPGVLVSWGCGSKEPEVRWLRTTKMYHVTAGGCKSKMKMSMGSVMLLGECLSLSLPGSASPRYSLACGYIIPVLVSIFTWSLPLCLCVSFNEDHHHIGLGAHPISGTTS